MILDQRNEEKFLLIKSFFTIAIAIAHILQTVFILRFAYFFYQSLK